MLRILNDPLLSLTQGLLRVAQVLLFSLAVLLAIVGTVAVLSGDQFSQYSTVTAAQRHSGGVLLLAMVPSFVVFGFFLRFLLQIVRTVSEGNPFVAANADRLTRMACLVVLLKVVFIVEHLLLGESAFARTRLPIPNGSVMLALTLFVLARVFRQGAAMREDLEGTV